jgi:hypothetical protein
MMEVLTLLGGAAAVFVATKLGFKAGERIEDRRRGTFDLAVWAQENGLSVVQAVLKNYTVGDKSGLIGSVRDLVELIRNPEQTKAALDVFLNTQLKKKLSTIEGQDELLSAIEKILGIVIDRDAIIKAPTSIGKVE